MLAILGVMVAGFGVFAFMMLSGGKKEADAAPPIESKPVVHSKPASAPPPIRVLKELPEDVRITLLRAADKISGRVDGLVKDQMKAEKLPSAKARFEAFEGLRDSFAAVADELEELLEDKNAVWAKYRHDPEYSHCFEQFVKRFNFYSSTQSQLRRLSETAKWEADKEAKEGAATKSDAAATKPAAAAPEKPAPEKPATEKPASAPAVKPAGK